MSGKVPPAGTQVATYRNVDRCAVNTAIFDMTCTHYKPAGEGQVLEEACLILADDLFMRDGAKTMVPITNNLVKRHFYQNCTESDIGKSTNRAGKMDPCLKIYQNCPMMFTKNEDVANGQANGSRVTVKGVSMKVGEQAFRLKLDNGTTILAAYASQVRSILVEHENDEIFPRRFEISSQTFAFSCKMEISGEDMFTFMNATAFPLISNSCTTGHKLQGCTVDSMLVNDWFYGANWPYVVLSRVKTLDGLYFRQKLSTDLKKYTKPKAMKDMLKVFREEVSATVLTDEQYRNLEEAEFVVPPTPDPDREPNFVY